MGMSKLLDEMQKIAEERLIEGLGKVPIPSHMHKAITAYVLEHRKPADFLAAVLESNLKEAVLLADEENMTALHHWINLLYWYVPGICWGSPDKVKAWVDQGVDEVEKSNGI